MPRPYTQKTVEDAALLCETLASNYKHLGGPEWACIFLGIRESSTAVELANAAFEACAEVVGRGQHWGVESWAEAAALIESGWKIGDEVELLPVSTPTERAMDAILRDVYPADSAAKFASTVYGPPYYTVTPEGIVYDRPQGALASYTEAIPAYIGPTDCFAPVQLELPLVGMPAGTILLAEAAMSDIPNDVDYTTIVDEETPITTPGDDPTDPATDRITYEEEN